MEYSLFLFMMLYQEVNKLTLEYDLLYQVILKDFKKYNDSQFNDPDKPEYDCMSKYLHNNIKRN